MQKDLRRIKIRRRRVSEKGSPKLEDDLRSKMRLEISLMMKMKI